jgi:hypothetical protein
MKAQIKEHIDEMVQEELVKNTQKKKKPGKLRIFFFILLAKIFGIVLFFSFLVFVLFGQGMGKKEETPPSTVQSNGMTVCRPGGKTVTPKKYNRI